MRAAADALDFEQAARLRDVVARAGRPGPGAARAARRRRRPGRGGAGPGRRRWAPAWCCGSAPGCSWGGSRCASRTWPRRVRRGSARLAPVAGTTWARATRAWATCPREVLLPADVPDRDLLAEILTRGGRAQGRGPRAPAGEKLRLVELAAQNARHVLEDRVTALAYAADRAEDALYSLQDELDLKVVPRLMVCFDISHTQGTETVASAVVFENGEPRKARLPPHAHQGRLGQRRLPLHGRGRDALVPARRGRGAPAPRPGGDRRREGAARRRGRGAGGPGAARRPGGRAGQEGGGGLPPRAPGAGAAGPAQPGAPPAPAHPRRGAPLRRSATTASCGASAPSAATWATFPGSGPRRQTRAPAPLRLASRASARRPGRRSRGSRASPTRWPARVLTYLGR